MLLLASNCHGTVVRAKSLPAFSHSATALTAARYSRLNARQQWRACGLCRSGHDVRRLRDGGAAGGINGSWRWARKTAQSFCASYLLK